MAVVSIPGLAPNGALMQLEALKARMGDGPWSVRIVENETTWANLHCQLPGQGNTAHYHAEPEWWVVIEGELEWSLGGQEYVRAKRGDIVYAGPNVSHHIRVVGDGPSLRLAIGSPNRSHHPSQGA
jgi:quercetin dioxygenase-like cupin family protein